MLTLWSAAAGCNNRMPMCIGSFSLHSKWIGLSKRYPNSLVLRRDVESDRLIGNKSILLTPLAHNFTCFKQNVLNLVFFPLETRLQIVCHFAYLVKVSWFKFFIFVYVGKVAASVWLVSVWLIIHTKLFIYFFITQIILIVFFSGQRNYLYDV